MEEHDNSFLTSGTTEWKSIERTRIIHTQAEDKSQDIQESESKIQANKKELEQILLSSLKMEHLVVLTGLGCSLSVGGPTMNDLWDEIVNKDQNTACKISDIVKYNMEEKNIETFLSHLDAWLTINREDTESQSETEEVEDYLKLAKSIILSKCSSLPNKEKTFPHRTFLHRLSRRRSRDQRVKLFTTNYDLCFEKAAGEIGAVAIDGFSFTSPRRYDPRFFDFDIVRRPRSANNQINYLEGVFLLYKLHGSVNWVTEGENIIEQDDPAPENACLIYPASNKYQQSYNQPYLESISQYLAAIREPNTCIIVVGFGFNDDHLSKPLLAAVRSNPHLRLIVVDPLIKSKFEHKNQRNPIHTALFELATNREDICFINTSFEQFSQIIPNLKSLSPAERLWSALHTQGEENEF